MTTYLYEWYSEIYIELKLSLVFLSYYPAQNPWHMFFFA